MEVERKGGPATTLDMENASVSVPSVPREPQAGNRSSNTRRLVNRRRSVDGGSQVALDCGSLSTTADVAGTFASGFLQQPFLCLRRATGERELLDADISTRPATTLGSAVESDVQLGEGNGTCPNHAVVTKSVRRSACACDCSAALYCARRSCLGAGLPAHARIVARVS